MAANLRCEFGTRTAEICTLCGSPGLHALSLSALVHCVGFVLLVILGYATRPRILVSNYEVATLSQGHSHLSFGRGVRAAARHPVHVASRSRFTLPSKQVSPPTTASGEALEGEARRQTAALIRSLKFRQIYGFYPGHDYQLPIRKSGEIPHISADLFPPRFSQFVVIDITIDTQGTVADAHIVAGIVEPPIQRLLLSAVREFKYVPAKRDNLPVPSQLEIVVPVPS